MSNSYVGVNGLARKVTDLYVGVNGVARRVSKGYVGVNGVARQFYSAAQPFAYTYTGTHAESDITIDGVDYTVITITSSGNLAVNRAINADVWMCGGGGNGAQGDNSSSNKSSGGGGGGGYIKFDSIQLVGNIVCVVGASTGQSTINAISASGGNSAESYSGGNGASGGGGGIGGNGSISGSGGNGSGISTIPSNFGSQEKHCAGGGGGLLNYSMFYPGGNGGSNGGNGTPGNVDGATGRPMGTAAEKGGGFGGGYNNALFATDATFYGSGGGGSSNQYDTVGSGYQGVIYMRWRTEDAE